MAHITEEQIQTYYQHRLSGQQEQTLLTHAASCEYCAGRLAQAFPQEELLTPVRGMTAQILDAAQSIPTRKRRQREFYGYCARVAVGMCMALGMMVSVQNIGQTAVSLQHMEIPALEKLEEGRAQVLQRKEEKKTNVI